MTPSDRKIVDLADEINQLLMERLDGPKDAAMALLLTHVLMTKTDGLTRPFVDAMLTEYATMFRKAYFGPGE